MPASIPNLAALVVALVCWAGLAIQFNATYSAQHDVVATLWVLLRFFTVITNLALALIMTRVALGGKVSAILLGGTTIAIILVGVVYMTLLRGLLELSGGALLADTLLHKVSPIGMTLWWVLFAPRARLKYNAPLLWALYPLAYFIYALVRANFDGRYPYPFMNLAKLGPVQTALNAGGIAMAFIIAGFLLVWFDGWRPLGSRRGSS